MLTLSVGYNDYQIYLLLSCAPVQGHIAGIVDVSECPFVVDI
jgi:acetamidase/formamidase